MSWQSHGQSIICEQIWSINFKQILNNHHLFIRHIRYVDNRLIFGDSRLRDLPPYEVLLDEGFYGKLIILETEPDQEFLGSCSKPNPWNSSTKDLPTFLRSYRRFLPPHQKYSSVAFALAAISLSKGHSLTFVFDKGLIN